MIKYDVEKISKKLKHKKMTKKVFKYIMLSIMIFLFIVNLMLSFEKNKLVFGIYMFNIISESMEPEFFKDDLVIVKKCNESELQIGDIITFTQGDRTISHRIIDITKDEDSTKFITKGDNNDLPDEDFVTPENIYGKVLFSVKKVGKLVNYVQNVSGLISVIIFIIILYILISLNEKHKDTRKIKRKKYEIKKIRDNYNS